MIWFPSDVQLVTARIDVHSLRGERAASPLPPHLSPPPATVVAGAFVAAVNKSELTPFVAAVNGTLDAAVLTALFTTFCPAIESDRQAHSAAKFAA